MCIQIHLVYGYTCHLCASKGLQGRSRPAECIRLPRRPLEQAVPKSSPPAMVLGLAPPVLAVSSRALRPEGLDPGIEIGVVSGGPRGPKDAARHGARVSAKFLGRGFEGWLHLGWRASLRRARGSGGRYERKGGGLTQFGRRTAACLRRRDTGWDSLRSLT